MTGIKISLPGFLKDFVDDQVSAQGYASSSEYVRATIRRDRDRQRLRGLLPEGAESPSAVAGRADYFDRLRDRVRESGQR